MRFLVDADLPRSLVPLLQAHGHEAEHISLLGRGMAPDEEVATLAQATAACLLTGDFGFADIRNYDPAVYAGIVVLELPRQATAPTILSQVERLLHQPEVLARLPGRLAILGPATVRLRPL